MASAVGISSRVSRTFQGLVMTTQIEIAPTLAETSSAPTRWPRPTRPGTSIWPGVMKMAKMIRTMIAPMYTDNCATARKSAPSKAYISATPPSTVVSASAARIKFLMDATIKYAAEIDATALTQKASVPAKLVKGSVVPNMTEPGPAAALAREIATEHVWRLGTLGVPSGVNLCHSRRSELASGRP